jgi:hypothetical protein
MCVEVMLDKNLIIQMLSYPHFSETIFISQVYILSSSVFLSIRRNQFPNKNSIHLSSFRNIYVLTRCKKHLPLNSTRNDLLSSQKNAKIRSVKVQLAKFHPFEFIQKYNF